MSSRGVGGSLSEMAQKSGPSGAAARAAAPCKAETPGAQITYDYCSGCHSEMIIAQQGQTRDGWDDILVWMVEDMGMGEIDNEDRNMILDYLATYYNPDRPHFPKN